VKKGWLGIVLSFLASLVLAYEGIALLDGPDGVPTISRLWQGVRDISAAFGVIMGLLALALGVGLMWFGFWVRGHLAEDERSAL
jgi:hypothetical protein